MIKIAIIKVNFASDNVMPDGNILGKVGEHNANILEVTPPNDMAENESIKLYCLAFEVGRDFIKKIVRSEMIAKADVFQIPLWSQVTVGESVKFQLEAYDGENNLLIKSRIVEGIFLPSVNGVHSQFDSSLGGLTSSVAANSAARHIHENADVLNALADKDGRLTYNGEAIGGGVSTNSKEYLMESGDVYFITASAGLDTVVVYGVFSDGNAFKQGTKISRIEIKTNENVNYRNITNFNISNTKPTISMTDEIVITTEGLAFFIGTCINGMTDNWKDIVENMNWYSVRITYYTD